MMSMELLKPLYKIYIYEFKIENGVLKKLNMLRFTIHLKLQMGLNHQ